MTTLSTTSIPIATGTARPGPALTGTTPDDTTQLIIIESATLATSRSAIANRQPRPGIARRVAGGAGILAFCGFSLVFTIVSTVVRALASPARERGDDMGGAAHRAHAPSLTRTQPV